ncbi:MAG: prepilin-type N-terminal cleavage/methylation domain-containing protein [Bacteroidales bacterium]|nr:prepilin-type N-terminal cleavage/methylation domain-containing protein [Bacteroidales bacterium]
MSIKSNKRYWRVQGFTLVEILLALTISSILILGTNAAYQQAYMIWSSIENRRLIYNTARQVTETLRQEASCLYIPSATEEEGQDNTMFRVSNLPDMGTELTFYTQTPFWNGTLEASRMAKVSYRFMKESESDTKQLIRIEEPCGGNKIIGATSSDVISDSISEFKVWAIDPNAGTSDNSWQESYESKDTPPKALKILLKWDATDKAPETEFESCIFVPCTSPVL